MASRTLDSRVLVMFLLTLPVDGNYSPSLIRPKKTVAAELFALREIMKIRYKTTLSSSALFLPMKTTILEKKPRRL